MNELFSFDHNLEVEARMLHGNKTRSCNVERELDCFSPNKRSPGIVEIKNTFRDQIFEVVTCNTHSGQKFRIRREEKNQTFLTYKKSRNHPRLFVDDEFSRLVPGIDETLAFLTGEYDPASLVRSTKKRTAYLVRMHDAELEICLDTQSPDVLYHLPEYIEIECLKIDNCNPLEDPDSYIEEAEKRIIEVADVIGFDPSAFTKKTIRQMEEEYMASIAQSRELCQDQLSQLEQDFGKKQEDFRKNRERIRQQFHMLRFSHEGKML